MRFFIQCVFWIQILCFVIRIFDLGLSTWPKLREISLGLRVTETISGMGIIVWTGILLFT
jgi:hypothetical protein